MADHVQLKAETRTMLGKKVRRLRGTGVLPATVYGNSRQPQSIQVNASDLRSVFKASGRTQMIDLVVDDQRPVPVFIKQTTVNAKHNELLHIEFFAANMRQRLHSQVPVHFTGESQAVKDGGILLTLLDHIDLESLPDDIPEAVEVDISQLTEIGSVLHASDLVVSSSVTLLTPPDELIAKVDPPVAQVVDEDQTPKELVAEAQAVRSEGGDVAGDDTTAQS
jgi:large subunit ribosomal protein L25